MSSLPGKLSPRFLQITDRRRELVVCSKVEWWVSHYNHKGGAPIRCAGESCALCHMGQARVLRFVMLVLDEHGLECLLELRERNRDKAERILATTETGRGVQITVKKEGAAKNSAISCSIIGAVPVMLRDISRLVACIGDRPQRVRVEGEPEGVNVALEPLQRSLE